MRTTQTKWIAIATIITALSTFGATHVQASDRYGVDIMPEFQTSASGNITVSVPKSIRAYEKNIAYDIYVSGELSPEQSLVVEPSITPFDDTLGGKDSVVANVSLEKTMWSDDELSTEPTKVSGSIAIPALSAGIWAGLMTVNVSAASNALTIASASEFNTTVKSLAGSLSNNTKIVFSSSGIPDDKLASARTIRTEEGEPLYAWYEGDSDRVVYIAARSTKAVIYAPVNSSNLFSEIVTSGGIEFHNFNTSKVTNMNQMFASTVTVSDMSGQYLDLSNWDVSNVTDMGYMFRQFSPDVLNLSGWNTASLTTMRNMFTQSKVKELYVDGWDVSKVTSMQEVFYNATELQQLDLSSWRPTSVTNLSHIFRDTHALASLDLSGWYTPNMTTVAYMFYNARSLTNVDLSHFGITKVTTADSMFYGATAMETINMSGWDTSQLTNIASAFRNVSSAQRIDLSGWTFPKITSSQANTFTDIATTAVVLLNDIPVTTNARQISYALSSNRNARIEMYNLKLSVRAEFMLSGVSIDRIDGIESWDVSGVTDLSTMFSSALGAVDLDLSSWDVSSATNLYYMFRGSAINSLKLSGWNTSKVTNMSYMFDNMATLSSLDISGFDTSRVTTMANMFQGVKSLTTLDVSNFNTSSVTTMTNLFSGMSSIEYLDLRAWRFDKITGTVSGAFSSIKTGAIINLDDLTITASPRTISYFLSSNSNGTVWMHNTKIVGSASYLLYGANIGRIEGFDTWDVSAVTDMSYMFYNASGATSLDLSMWDTSNVTNMNNMFYGAKLQTLDVSNWNTAKVTHMYYMFASSTITDLDLSSFDTANVTDMSRMFADMSSLTSLDVSSFRTPKITSVRYMFSGVNKLTKLDLSSFDTSKVTDMTYVFQNTNALASLNLSGWSFESLKSSASSAFSNMKGTIYLDNIVTRTNARGVSHFLHNSTAGATIYMRNAKIIGSAELMLNSVQIGRIRGIETWDVSEATSFRQMFNSSQGVEYSLDLSAWDTSNVTDMSYMFNGQGLLTHLDLSGFDTSKVTTFAYMFQNTSKLTEIVISDTFVRNNNATITDMFKGSATSFTFANELAIPEVDDTPELDEPIIDNEQGSDTLPELDEPNIDNEQGSDTLPELDEPVIDNEQGSDTLPELDEPSIDEDIPPDIEVVSADVP